jgi:hypothetical protein
MNDNPYAGLPTSRFWRRAIGDQLPSAVDPVVHPCFVLQPEHLVATAGSCFAQHISRALTARGFGFFVTETAPEGLAPELVRARNFNVFTARYGNIYTTRQLLQLFDRAFGAFKPVEDVWGRPDGRFVDPFRPNIEPDGFATPEELRAERARHFASIRRMFQELDVFVFTLGLTEAWCSRRDGAIFPVAPGVAGGHYESALHKFVNLEVEDVVADFTAFLNKLREINFKCRILLTVSPVPLIATYEDRHVLVSTTYSKSVLRVAADKLCRMANAVDYFPSYEIITGNFSGGRYFDADLRTVNELGIDHAMRVFLTHYTGATGPGVTPDVASLDARRKDVERALSVICDEEAIDKLSP